jgi:very-short-patch-repair endonuclease
MSGEENLANSVSDWILSETALSYPIESFNPHKWGSPIERLFHHAIMFSCQLGVSWFEITFDEPTDIQKLKIETQALVLDWPVDFLLTVKSEYGLVSRLVIECDGHEFHERTKEQAKRDRSRDRRLQDAGLTVYRFTGSEIYRNSFGCARQALKWAEGAAFKKSRE